MPYSKEHKQEVRARIVEAARRLFNRHGFDNVTIDQLMAEAGLTRGGFYSHFDSKEAVFAAATASFLHGRGAIWREDAGVDPSAGQVEMAKRMVASYLSRTHLDQIEDQCPLIAYATDVARAGPQVQESYRELLDGMVSLFEHNLEGDPAERGKRARALAAMCVGGMVIARALPGTDTAEEIRRSALAEATTLWIEPTSQQAA
ncbi:MAG: helix-turn-helix domain-containing protein [Pseudomonadota bacterium]